MLKKLLHILAILLILSSCPTHANEIDTITHPDELSFPVDDLEKNINLTPSTSLIQDNTNDWEIAPGVTDQLLIRLQGAEEQIFIDFQADKLSSSSFSISVLVNQYNNGTSFYNFTENETLSLKLDYLQSEGILTGDNGFLQTFLIHDNYYEVVVTQEKLSHGAEAYLSEISKHTHSSTVLVKLSVIFLTIIILLALLTVALRIRKVKATRNMYAEPMFSTRNLITSAVNSQTLSKELPIVKNDSSNKEANTIEFNKNKEFLSRASTASSLRLGTLTSSPKGFSELAHQALAEEDPDIVFKTIPDVDALVPNKPKACDSVVIEGHEECHASKRPHIYPVPQVVKTIKNEPTLALDMDFEDDNSAFRRMPTEREIRALVQMLQEQGELGCQDPSEASSDDEDQYEAPVLPNYFCCMLCFEGKRSIVVEPCRHVFGCKACVDDLLRSYKVCLLCSKPITQYQSLDD